MIHKVCTPNRNSILIEFFYVIMKFHICSDENMNIHIYVAKKW
jgi:hypothetical protein